MRGGERRESTGGWLGRGASQMLRLADMPGSKQMRSAPTPFTQCRRPRRTAPCAGAGASRASGTTKSPGGTPGAATPAAATSSATGKETARRGGGGVP